MSLLQYGALVFFAVLLAWALRRHHLKRRAQQVERLIKSQTGIVSSEPEVDKENQQSAVRWVDPAHNPWGVPILDVRPVTLGMVSMTSNPQYAENALSFGQDDGTRFIGIEPEATRTVTVGLRYPIDPALADGALFIPKQMEHKWAIYFHRGQILFIRSWLRQVRAVAQTQNRGDSIEIETLRGAFEAPDEAPSFTVRVFDYLLRTHALGTAYPAPLPPDLAADPQTAAMWCFSRFGNLAHFATPHEFPPSIPSQPLRSH